MRIGIIATVVLLIDRCRNCATPFHHPMPSLTGSVPRIQFPRSIFAVAAGALVKSEIKCVVNHTITYLDPHRPVINLHEMVNILENIGNTVASVTSKEIPTWRVVVPAAGISFQDNLTDCGVFVMAYMFSLVFKLPLDSFHNSDIPLVRRNLLGFLLKERVLQHQQ